MTKPRARTLKEEIEMTRRIPPLPPYLTEGIGDEARRCSRLFKILRERAERRRAPLILVVEKEDDGKNYLTVYRDS
jgi:hypothetical protein